MGRKLRCHRVLKHIYTSNDNSRQCNKSNSTRTAVSSESNSTRTAAHTASQLSKTEASNKKQPTLQPILKTRSGRVINKPLHFRDAGA